MTAKDYTAIQADVDSLLANNTTGNIEADELNTLLTNIIDGVQGRDSYVAKTGAYTLTESDTWVTVDTTGGAVTITLPAVASTRIGKTYVVQKIAGGNNVTLDGNASETINGATTKTISTQYSGILCINTGAAWFAVALSAA